MQVDTLGEVTANDDYDVVNGADHHIEQIDLDIHQENLLDQYELILLLDVDILDADEVDSGVQHRSNNH